MWKTTFVASGYICFAVYFDFLKVIFLAVAKVIFRPVAEVEVNPQHAHGAHRAIGASLLPRQKHRFIAFTMYPLLCSSQGHIALHIIKNLTKSTRLGAKYSSLKTARI